MGKESELVNLQKYQLARERQRKRKNVRLEQTETSVDNSKINITNYKNSLKI